MVLLRAEINSDFARSSYCFKFEKRDYLRNFELVSLTRTTNWTELRFRAVAMLFYIQQTKETN
jgi:hypothetical protein